MTEFIRSVKVLSSRDNSISLTLIFFNEKKPACRSDLLINTEAHENEKKSQN